MKSYHVVIHCYFNSSSETDAILNALNSTPSVQPIRATKGSTNNAVKRSAESNLPSSHFDKRHSTLPPAPVVSNSVPFINQPVSMSMMMPQIQQIPMSFQSAQSRPIVSDWQVFKTPAGVEYYYNQRTRATTYEKPDELKSEAERSLKVFIHFYQLMISPVRGKNSRLHKAVRIGAILSRRFPCGKNLRSCVYTKLS